MNITARIGSTYYCPIDDKVYKVTGKHTVVEDHDPHDIRETKAKNIHATNWRDFHVEGEKHPAGERHPRGGGHSGGAQGTGGHGRGSRGNQPTTTQNLARPPSGPISGNVSSWIDEAASVLAQRGVHISAQDKKYLVLIAMHESSGNPNAINLQDGNAAAGHPSIGLMQTIQSTFDAFKLPGHDNIRNPVDNIIAAYRYAIATYGSLDNVPGVKSVNRGGPYIGY